MTWMWEWFLAANDISDAQVSAACQDVFCIEPARMITVDSILSMPGGDQSWDVIVERGDMPGDFPVQYTLYLREGLASWNADADREVLVRICVATGVDCLIEDGWVDPYSMLRIRPSGIVEAVDLDGARLDDDEAYVVQQVRGIVPPPYVAAVNSPAAS